MRTWQPPQQGAEQVDPEVLPRQQRHRHRVDVAQVVRRRDDDDEEREHRYHLPDEQQQLADDVEQGSALDHCRLRCSARAARYSGTG